MDHTANDYFRMRTVKVYYSGRKYIMSSKLFLLINLIVSISCSLLLILLFHYLYAYYINQMDFYINNASLQKYQYLYEIYNKEIPYFIYYKLQILFLVILPFILSYVYHLIHRNKIIKSLKRIIMLCIIDSFPLLVSVIFPLLMNYVFY